MMKFGLTCFNLFGDIFSVCNNSMDSSKIPFLFKNNCIWSLPTNPTSYPFSFNILIKYHNNNERKKPFSVNRKSALSDRNFKRYSAREVNKR